jgi:hypothetical protein
MGSKLIGQFYLHSLERAESAMPKHTRHFWGPQNSGPFNFNWNIIRHDSLVVITASEGAGYDVSPAPQRIIGAAWFFTEAIAPQDEPVTFSIRIVYRT